MIVQKHQATSCCDVQSDSDRPWQAFITSKITLCSSSSTGKLQLLCLNIKHHVNVSVRLWRSSRHSYCNHPWIWYEITWITGIACRRHVCYLSTIFVQTARETASMRLSLQQCRFRSVIFDTWSVQTNIISFRDLKVSHQKIDKHCQVIWFNVSLKATVRCLKHRVFQNHAHLHISSAKLQCVRHTLALQPQSRLSCAESFSGVNDLTSFYTHWNDTAVCLSCKDITHFSNALHCPI